MAATKVKQSTSTSLLALSSAALMLPGITAKAASPEPEPKATAQYGYYAEEGDRITANVYHGDFVVPVKDWAEFTFSFDQDTYVGATPSYSVPAGISELVTAASDVAPEALGLNALGTSPRLKPTQIAVINDIINGKLPLNTDPVVEVIRRLIETPVPDFNTPVQVLSQQPLESRNQPVLGANFYLGPVTLGFTGGYSNEPDFHSVFGSGNVNLELNHKLTTLSAGYSLANNDIIRAAVTQGGPHDHGTGGLKDFEASNTYRTIDLGFSQVLGKNTLFHLNGDYTRQRGFLSNPYKLVYIQGEITPEEFNQVAFVEGSRDVSGWKSVTDLEVAGVNLFREVRPEQRDQWVLSAGVNQHITPLDASVQFDYRYYQDNWDITSHTFELTWYQNFPFGITVTPNIRYYSQSAANFYAPFFLAPRADGLYSSDYRLSGFGKISGGLTISKEFSKGIRLDAGFEYSTHKGSLKLGGGGEHSFADITSYLLHAGLHMELAKLGSSLVGENSHHSRHMHHGIHPPAGVMFAHMLPKANAFMVSYNYAFSDWSDEIQHGRINRISDQEIIDQACDDDVCSFKAKRMIMHMHMLNFMYAPTDWLNLMVMPQFAYKKMDMQPLPNQPPEIIGGFHEATGLGDTLMVALIKLFENDMHHAHVGLGISAPTGRTDITFTGLPPSKGKSGNDLTQVQGNPIQSFDMQLGSGTWDIKPNLTYTGHYQHWSWGAQVNATVRMQDKNKEGYRLGNEIQGSVWGGYQALDWLSFSLRNIYRVQGKVHGKINEDVFLGNGVGTQLTPLENPANHGGKFWDIGIGATISAPDSVYSGHHLSVEWLQPVIHDLNGYQLHRNGTLAVRWGYAF